MAEPDNYGILNTMTPPPSDPSRGQAHGPTVPTQTRGRLPRWFLPTAWSLVTALTDSFTDGTKWRIDAGSAAKPVPIYTIPSDKTLPPEIILARRLAVTFVTSDGGHACITIDSDGQREWESRNYTPEVRKTIEAIHERIRHRTGLLLHPGMVVIVGMLWLILDFFLWATFSERAESGDPSWAWFPVTPTSFFAFLVPPLLLSLCAGLVLMAPSPLRVWPAWARAAGKWGAGLVPVLVVAFIVKAIVG